VALNFKIVNPEAIWNTNAFFAYIISVKLFKSRWEFRRLLAVVIATVGTFTVVYSGATSGEPPSVDDGLTITSISLKPTAPLLGNLLTLVASFSYGLYQVLYTIYAALPSDPEVASDPMYEQIPDDDVEDEAPADVIHIDPAEAVYPPPFGFHPNLLTSLMGFMTLITLWIPIPFLHWSGAEVFRVPPNALTALSIAGIALSGVVFNAGFMVNVSMSISLPQDC
jgi:drug/metabolite transporter (DMT)-like permease